MKESRVIYRPISIRHKNAIDKLNSNYLRFELHHFAENNLGIKSVIADETNIVDEFRKRG